MRLNGNSTAMAKRGIRLRTAIVKAYASGSKPRGSIRCSNANIGSGCEGLRLRSDSVNKRRLRTVTVLL